MNQEIKIESGVPLPLKRHLVTKNDCIYEKLKLGDSVFFDSLSKANVFIIGIKQYSCRELLGIKVTRRKVEENGKIGFRVWRTK